MIDIKKYEAMSKLSLPETERQWVAEEAEKLLKSFSCLENINTEGIDPLITVLDIKNVFREDTVKKMITKEELLSNAPTESGSGLAHNGYFEVPKTLD